MNPRQLAIAERVLERADREHPADAVLRDQLRRAGGVSRREASEVSAAVFACFRWLQWLDPTAPVAERLSEAMRLSEQFRQSPGAFSETELRARAVPSWTGEQLEIRASWLRALQKEPPLWLRVRRGRGVPPVPDCEPHAFLPNAFVYHGGEDLFRTPGFQSGEFELQDVSSQAVGWICAPQPRETWWDACAGEGGKLLHLSDLMENKGLIWASDRAEWRLRKLKQRAARAGVFNYRSVSWDGGPRLPTKTRFDGALVDAPCSGVGTWQRNPRARWTTTLADVEELASLQKQLLGHAAPAVKPGGRLVYAVCTLTRSETQEVAQWFEENFQDFEPVPQSNPCDPAAAPSPRVWIHPEDCGGNGMFVVVWRRKAGA